MAAIEGQAEGNQQGPPGWRTDLIEMAATEGQGGGLGNHQGPPGWTVEARPRTNEKYLWKTDWFYYEPGTQRQYRSLKKAWARYEELNRRNPEKPNMKKLARMKMRTASFDSAKPPESVTWAFTDPDNDQWDPYVGGEKIHGPEKMLWAESFELSMLWKDWPGNSGGTTRDTEEGAMDVDAREEEMVGGSGNA
ncbi:hypothetical protein RHSIM_Rhsim05G0193300 [Rhododendron simsii]|uniref:Uncharacterized protein n=1 Tax=Rhododendron simsii TaxID=118357 RepID=A0A834LQC3_RHOSS|nr:hypothetical protein RHSIM_Rhsim05G0193300 [Rhododendron simsii]